MIVGVGAYATSNLITRTDIFAAAVSGATPPELFRNWASGRDRDSRNIETGQARMGGSPFEYPERYLSQSAFFHLDSQWRFGYVNAEAERLLGRTRNELSGGSIWELFPAAVGSDFETHYRGAM